jgi:PleD family two-component response regulator
MTGSFHKKMRDKIVDKNVIYYIVLEDDQQLELLQATVHRIVSNEHRMVLIVDDSKPSRFALRTLLQSKTSPYLKLQMGWKP